MARLRASQKQEHREPYLKRLGWKGETVEQNTVINNVERKRKCFQVLICWHRFVRIEKEEEEKEEEEEEEGRGCVCVRYGAFKFAGETP